MPMIWLALVVSWALVRAFEETWGYGKKTSAPARSKLAKTVKARSKRGDWVPGKKNRRAKGRGSWWGWFSLTLLWLTGQTLRHGWGVAKAIGRGVRRGYGQARRIYREIKEAREARTWDWGDWEECVDEAAEDGDQLDDEDIVDGEVLEDLPPEEFDPTPEPPLDEEGDIPADEPDTTPDNEPEITVTIPVQAQREILMNAITTGEAPNLAAARVVAGSIKTALADGMSAVEQLIADLAAAGVGRATQARFYGVLDALSTAMSEAASAAHGMEADHALIEEAINARPDAVAANTSFYQGG